MLSGFQIDACQIVHQVRKSIALLNVQIKGRAMPPKLLKYITKNTQERSLQYLYRVFHRFRQAKLDNNGGLDVGSSPFSNAAQAASKNDAQFICCQK